MIKALHCIVSVYVYHEKFIYLLLSHVVYITVCVTEILLLHMQELQSLCLKLLHMLCYAFSMLVDVLTETYTGTP